MQIWMNLLLAVQIVAALVMIGLVLIQHGKGADMGASFGGGASGSLFGATGSANFLSRSTAACATVFFVATLGLALLSNQNTARPGGGSVLDRPVAPASGGPATPTVPAIPGAAPTAAPAVPASVPAAGAAPAAVPSPALSAQPSAVPAPASQPAAVPAPASQPAASAGAKP
jgi:preprotein translocase subunit SecG